MLCCLLCVVRCLLFHSSALCPFGLVVVCVVCCVLCFVFFVVCRLLSGGCLKSPLGKLGFCTCLHLCPTSMNGLLFFVLQKQGVDTLACEGPPTKIPTIHQAWYQLRAKTQPDKNVKKYEFKTCFRVRIYFHNFTKSVNFAPPKLGRCS